MRLLNTTLAIVLLITGASCKKSADFTETPEQAEARADVNAASAILRVETFVNELEFIARQMAVEQPPTSFLNCASITKTDIPDGKKVEIAFSAVNTCSDNTTRSGKLSITYQTATGNIFITSHNYTVGGLLVSGNYSFQPITEQQKSFLKLVVPDGKLTNAYGEYISFNMERKNEFKAGSGTTDTNDDIFETSGASYDVELKQGGTATLIDASSHSAYTVKYSCAEKYLPHNGKVKFKRANGNERYLVWGTGNCSDQASVANTP